MKPLPPTVEALIEELEHAYPPRCIAADETLEAAHRYAGAQELVAALRTRLNHTIQKRAVAKELLHVHGQ